MPFMPLSPTRLYPSHKYKIHKAGAKASPESKDIDMAASEGSSPNIESSPESANLNSTGHPSSWKGATIRHVTDDDQALRNDTEHTRNCKSAVQAHDCWSHENEWDQESQSQTVTRSRSIQSDNASESEYSVEEDTGPVLGRASTVRVSRPNIIENKPTKIATSRSLPSTHLRSNSLTSQEVDCVEECQAEKPPSIIEEIGLAQSTTDSNSNAFSHSPMPESFRMTRDNNSTQNSTNVQLALPTGSTLHSIHPSILQPEIPPTSNDKTPKVGLNRAASAPLPLPRRGLSRRVTIRPPDIVTKSRDQNSSFRESVVTTPYPPHLPNEIGSPDLNQNEKTGSTEQQHCKGKKRNRVSFPNAQGERDRFPSPERPQVLFLNIGIAKRPYALKRVEVEIVRKSTFDDQALFEQIRTVYYKQLVHSYRRIFLLVRKVQHVTFSGSYLFSSEPDTANFLQHLQNPRSGHKRKTWTTWLRKQNLDHTSRYTGIDRARIRQIDDLNRLSGRARSNPHSRNTSGSSSRDAENPEGNKGLSTASDASSFYFAYSPAMPKLPFLSHRHHNDNLHIQSNSHPPSSHPNSFFWPSITGSQHSDGNTIFNAPIDTETFSKTPTIYIHHTFRLSIIALLFLLNVLLSTTCATTWVIFGVPGSGPGRNTTQQLGDNITIIHDWRVDAQARVFVGVIIGLVVLLVGCLGEAALVWAAWVFL